MMLKIETEVERVSENANTAINMSALKKKLSLAS